ncbi:aquaporin [bacterium]|nr:aquaporin [bacterium]
MKLSRFFAEFIGVFALVFMGVSAIVSNHLSGGALGLVGIALAHGLAIAILVTVAAPISGGHLNPAVSFGLFISGIMNLKETAWYILAQVLGGVAATITVSSLFPADALLQVSYGTPLPGANADYSQAFMAELFATFFLMLAVLGTAVDGRAPKLGGLFIGLAVVMGILAIGPVSGGAMNPARHFGPALFAEYTKTFWVYWAGPMVGAAFAAIIYRNFLND